MLRNKNTDQSSVTDGKMLIITAEDSATESREVLSIYYSDSNTKEKNDVSYESRLECPNVLTATSDHSSSFGSLPQVLVFQEVH